MKRILAAATLVLGFSASVAGDSPKIILSCTIDGLEKYGAVTAHHYVIDLDKRRNKNK